MEARANLGRLRVVPARALAVDLPEHLVLADGRVESITGSTLPVNRPPHIFFSSLPAGSAAAFRLGAIRGERRAIAVSINDGGRLRGRGAAVRESDPGTRVPGRKLVV